MKKDFVAERLVKVEICLLAAILVLMPFHAFFTTWLGVTFGHADVFRIWKELLLVPLALGALWLSVRDPVVRQWLKTSKLFYLVLIYVFLHLGLGLLALYRQQVSELALVYGLLSNLRFLVFFGCCLLVSRQNIWLRTHWAPLILIPGVIVVLFGLAQTFLLPPLFLEHFGYSEYTILPFQYVDNKPDFIRIQSTLRGANPLGAYLVILLTTLLGAVIILRSKKRLVALGGFLATTVALFFTYSRSAWIGFLISGIMVVWWSYKHKRHSRMFRQVIVLLVVVTGLLSFSVLKLIEHSYFVQNTILHTDQAKQQTSSSNSVRLTLMGDGLRQLEHDPLGNGPGSAGPASTRNTRASARISENYFLQIGLEVGWVGLAVFLGILGLVFMELWYAHTSLLPRILLASFVGITFINLVSHAWTDDTLSFLWWGLAGIALGPGILEPKLKKHAKTVKSHA